MVKTSHLICWCSTPLARRKRKNREAIAKPPRTPTQNTNTRAWTRSATLSKPSIPKGFSIGQTSQIGTGNNASTATPTMAATPTSQAKGRQRPEGRRPSGNSSTKKPIRAANGTHTHEETRRTEQPANRVLWAARGEEKPDCRVDHTTKSALNPEAVDFHLRVEKV